jgi:hypothetical protein
MELEEEFNMTQEDLDEIEACEDWVAQMAMIELAEREHLVELALRHAPQEKLAEIEGRIEMLNMMQTK